MCWITRSRSTPIASPHQQRADPNRGTEARSWHADGFFRDGADRAVCRCGRRTDSAGHGYDHNFVLNNPGKTPGLAARVQEPRSGRSMDVLTTQPGLQLYTGNWLDGAAAGKGGRRYPRYGGVCLETGHLPDSPNQPGFPSAVLRPGETYRHHTLFSFATVS